jgi:hypothetical protein
MDEEIVEELTDLYDEDLHRIRQIPGLSLIEP